MLTDFYDPVALGISLDIFDSVLADSIKRVLVDLAVDLGMSGVICINSASKSPRNQGESVGFISQYIPPVDRKPYQVELDLKRIINMLNECESVNKHLFYITDSFKDSDYYRIGKCFRLAKQSDLNSSLNFYSFGNCDEIQSDQTWASDYFHNVEDFDKQIRAVVLG